LGRCTTHIPKERELRTRKGNKTYPKRGRKTKTTSKGNGGASSPMKNPGKEELGERGGGGGTSPFYENREKKT